MRTFTTYPISICFCGDLVCNCLRHLFLQLGCDFTNRAVCQWNWHKVKNNHIFKMFCQKVESSISELFWRILASFSKNKDQLFLRSIVSRSAFLKQLMAFPSRHMTSFQRLQDVYTTSPTSYKRLVDVETNRMSKGIAVKNFRKTLHLRCLTGF